VDLLSSFSYWVKFYTLEDGSKVLGVRFGSLKFASSFFQKALARMCIIHKFSCGCPNELWDLFVNVLLKGFHIYFEPSPPLGFQCQFSSFDSTLIHIFGKLLCPSSLECLKGFLVHWQVSSPIFHFNSNHCYNDLFGTWVLVALLIASQNCCHFFIKSYKKCNLGMLSF
jgi:hypothetical protein